MSYQTTSYSIPGGSVTKVSYSYSSSSGNPGSYNTPSYGYSGSYGGSTGKPSTGYGVPTTTTSYTSYGTPSTTSYTSHGTPSTTSYNMPSYNVSSTSSYNKPTSYGGTPAPTYQSPTTYNPTVVNVSAPGGYKPSGGYNFSVPSYSPAPTQSHAYAPTPYTNPVVQAKNESKAAEKDNYLANVGSSLYKQSLNVSVTESHYKDVIESCKRSKSKWRDPDFPPEFRSLWGFGESISDVSESDWRSLKWARTNEIFPNGARLFEKIESNDISQGTLGDCYFLSSLSAIAENPARIERLFETKDLNEHGVIVVKLNPSGTWIEVVIDDHFPVYAHDKTPCFTKNVGNEIWVLALEKAYAKCFGGYLNIDAGMTIEALRDLTGAPTTQFDPTQDDTEHIWHHIIEGERKNYIMTAGSSENAGRDQISDIGLVGSHAYSLLAAYEIIDEYGKKRMAKSSEEAKKAGHVIRLVKLRNPWGNGTQGEWKGDWSDKDYRWTPELRRELQMTDEDDGVFCMPYDTFCEYFDEVVICRYHDDYELSAKQYRLSANKGKRIYFEITRQGTYYMSFSQKHRKYYPRSADYEYSLLTCVVGKVLGNGKYEYIEGKSTEDKDVWTKCDMTPGKYCAYIRAYWNHCDGKERNGVFGIYGPQKVDFREVDKSEVPKDFLNQLYISRGEKTLGKDKLKSYAAYNEPDVTYGYEKTDDGFGYFYFNNQSRSGSTLIAKLSLKQCKGVKLMHPFNNCNDARLPVKPGEKGVILFKYTDQYFSLNYGLSPEFQKQLKFQKEKNDKL